MSVDEAITNPPKNGKDEKGRFLPGHSFGKGRSPGSRSKATILMAQIMEDASKGVVDVLLKQALAGKIEAIRIIMDKLYPNPKTRPITLDIPPIEDMTTACYVMANIANEVAAGNLTPDEGMSVAAIVEVYRKTFETNVIDQRMNDLEAKLTKAGI